MSRLTYSPKAVLRSIQVSRVKLHVYVEGRQLDAYVYGSLLRNLFQSPFEYRIVRADELISSLSGGKPVLLDFFEKLRRAGRLVDDFQGQRSANLFLLDKDIDDIKRTKKRSLHVMYTESYDLEGDVIRHGDLAEALAATCSLDPAAASRQLNGDDWRKAALDSYRPWIEFCVAIQVNGVKLPNYGSHSKVHAGDYRVHDQVAYARFSAEYLAACLALGTDGVPLKRRADGTVARDFVRTDGYGVFKGKWFSVLFQQFALASFPTETRRVSGFPERLVGQISQTLKGNPNWGHRYSQRMKQIHALA